MSVLILTHAPFQARRAKKVMLARLHRECGEVSDETQRFQAKAARLRVYR